MKSIFNSLGSNYDRRFIWASFGFGTQKDTRELKKILHDTYNAETIQLTFKGREAITLILRQLNLPEGSLVAVNGFTCYAVYEAISAAGLKPYYLDIEEKDLNFTATTLEKAFKSEKKIKAVLLQNTLGMVSDAAGIKRLCNKYEATLVEDLAHSAGMIYPSGEQAGTLANYSALSFSQDKVIDGVSGGAAVFKIDTEIVPTKWLKTSFGTRFISRIYPSSAWLIRKTFTSGLGRGLLKFMKSAHLLSRPMSGEASKAHILPPWYSGLTVKSFNKLDNSLEHRQKIASIYRTKLPKANCFKHHDNNIYLRFPLTVINRKDLIKFLKKWHIYLSDTWYDAPIGPKKYLDKTDYKLGTCPNAEAVSANIVNLPTHINVSQSQAAFIAEKVNEWLNLEK